jgi:DNA-binding NtrC family response regulator
MGFLRLRSPDKNCALAKKRRARSGIADEDMMVAEKPRILVVEDDLLVSEVIAAALDDDYETALVETSAAAAERLSGGNIDLLLLDCTLPDGIGEELLPGADALGVPVLLMSGDPSRIERLAEQARQFVLKPFTLTDLVDAVENVLSAHLKHRG